MIRTHPSASWRQRVAAADWAQLAAELDGYGCARTPELLTAEAAADRPGLVRQAGPACPVTGHAGRVAGHVPRGRPGQGLAAVQRTSRSARRSAPITNMAAPDKREMAAAARGRVRMTRRADEPRAR